MPLKARYSGFLTKKQAWSMISGVNKGEMRRNMAILHGLRLYRRKVAFNSKHADPATRQYFEEELRMTDNLIKKFENILLKLNFV